MKKFLPIFLSVLFFFVNIFFFSEKSFAQTTPSPSSVVSITPPNTWQVDSEVTFVGKSGARSGAFLDWALRSYKWSEITTALNDPLSKFWITIRNIVYALLLVFILVTAFIIIVTQGKSITFSRFIPRFILMVFLITFSFALVQFIYQIGDIIQTFFLKKADGTPISHADLLYIGFDYKNFIGYRLTGIENDESAFISLLLIKLTTVTYYIMTGVLIIRKIILWLFIIVSPIFPLLILYSPIRNTAKIWLGEFLRWVLYAPLFTVFLAGLVSIWKAGIPLFFNNFAGVGTEVVYPTAINILLGGPGQLLSIKNSVNLPETFALYVVAIIMLWGVIVLPFILLRIFLDYFHAYSFGESALTKQFIALSTNFFKRPSGPFTPSPSTPTPYLSTGQARTLPFGHAISIPKTESIANVKIATTSFERPVTTSNIYSQPTQRFYNQNTQILKLANLDLPTLHDIARYDTSLISSQITKHQEVSRVHETLEKISNPILVSNPIERQRYVQIKESLQTEKQKGNPVAVSVLSAANSVVKTSNKESIISSTSQIMQNVTDTQIKEFIQKLGSTSQISSTIEKEEFTTLKNQLISESKNGDTVATSILNAAENSSKTQIEETTIKKIKEEIVASKDKESAASVVKHLAKSSGQKIQETGAPVNSFPAVNKVQTVSFDDYEAVKKMWQESYQKQEVPKSLNGQDRTREEWIKNDIDKINHATNLLSSNDPEKVKEGMESVSHILPFLLIGGFSQTEVIAYLKAKQEAGKSVLSDIDKKQQEEESMVDVKEKKEETPKEMQMEAKIENKDEKNLQN